jgi:hypothetical protein
MSRREAVRRIALLLGGAMVASEAILRGQSAPGKASAEAFTQADRELLDEIGEAIIPATDIPGAKAAGIGAFMAMMVADCYSEREHAVFREGLAKVEQACVGALAAELDSQRGAYEAKKGKDEPAHYFRMMKELTVLGYFSSEIGCTRAVRYVEVPGRFDADIPYRKGDPAWF